MSRIAALIACFLFAFSSFCQSVYEKAWEKEGEIIAVSSIMAGTSYLVDFTLPKYNITDINSLSILSINAFDRPATLHFSDGADLLSDVFISLNSFAPLGLFLLERTKSEKGTIFLMYGETFLLNSGITLLVKSMTQRSRPYAYNPTVPLSEKLSNKSKKSFFSGHVSQSAAFSFFGAKVFSDLYPDSKFKPIVWTAAITLPMVTAYGRYKAGQHFPSDLIVGYAVGAAIGVFIPILHKSHNQVLDKLKISTSVNGLGLSYSLY